MSLKIKICGMLDGQNIIGVSELNPDILGFIFYQESPRYAALVLDPATIGKIPGKIKKAGVFVNADFEEIKATIKRYSLDIAQLHGNEKPAACERLKETGITVIKAFNIRDRNGFKLCSTYKTSTDYFLFDASSSAHGGSGIKFDWKLLDEYDLDHPFFLSGGIGPQDTNNIKGLKNPSFYGIDINSRFETSPGIKDIMSLNTFISGLRLNNF
jgi:phosphoribosylanthranilate isomerase